MYICIYVCIYKLSKGDVPLHKIEWEGSCICLFIFEKEILNNYISLLVVNKQVSSGGKHIYATYVYLFLKRRFEI